jgi:DNA-binding transcriptional MerR regulator
MTKAADAFRTISEVADMLGVPAHVLRFWESRFSQIKPVKRAGGRRYYRPADVALLQGIKRLLHDQGITIRGVQIILQDKGIKHVAALAGGAVSPPPEQEPAAPREPRRPAALPALPEPAAAAPRQSAPEPRRTGTTPAAVGGEDEAPMLFDVLPTPSQPPNVLTLARRFSMQKRVEKPADPPEVRVSQRLRHRSALSQGERALAQVLHQRLRDLRARLAAGLQG